jgi:hypothetical protein
VSAAESDVTLIKTTIYTLMDGDALDSNLDTLSNINSFILANPNVYDVMTLNSRLVELEGVVSVLTTA